MIKDLRLGEIIYVTIYGKKEMMAVLGYDKDNLLAFCGNTNLYYLMNHNQYERGNTIKIFKHVSPSIIKAFKSKIREDNLVDLREEKETKNNAKKISKYIAKQIVVGDCEEDLGLIKGQILNAEIDRNTGYAYFGDGRGEYLKQNEYEIYKPKNEKLLDGLFLCIESDNSYKQLKVGNTYYISDGNIILKDYGLICKASSIEDLNKKTKCKFIKINEQQLLETLELTK